ncbi:histidine kinase dimerization/phosphoacceptor domain -containing protein [Methylorubrum rhodesianum]|uniref:histidine kinase n=1 Tax=Methylorubrum rhodesianum TaxID=29427 RepID=A0ABU9Z7K2_9HYPH
MAYRLRQQQLAAEFGLYALRARDIDALLQEATRLCAEGLQSRFCKIMEYIPDEHQFVVQAGVGWKPGLVGSARTGADSGSPSGYAFQTGEPVLSNHLEGESRFRTTEVLAEHGIKRAINVIIRADGVPFGVLEVDSPTEGRFTEADTAFLQGIANLLGSAIDRHRSEEALRRSEDRLQEALAHQEVLTREISHRVKNSLAVVAGLLSVQGGTAIDPALRAALTDAQARVLTIAKVHDQLWRRNEVENLDLAEFLQELCVQLRASTGPSHTIACEVEPITVNTDQAVSLGLIVNELVTNAIKYAYPGGAGEVRLSVTRLQPKCLRLEVCDRGMGLPPDFDTAKSKSLGLKLIVGLVRQLGGRAEWQDAQPGTRFVLEFPHCESAH